jgi:adenylosuccinate synthase
MAVVAVVGAQWGDEGKGKVVDVLSTKAHVVVRYQGGSNAGHTIVNHLGTFRLHLVPSGILKSGVTCVIGNGVVVDPELLIEELDNLEKMGVDTSGLRISERAHIVMPYHALQDRLEEEARGEWKIGTTLRGIGPAYADKVAREGIRMVDLLDLPDLRGRLSYLVGQKNLILGQAYGAAPVSVSETYAICERYRERLASYITDTSLLLADAIDDGKNVVLEGAQGTLIDLEFGTYPFVTSSSPTVGAACTGTGIPPRAIDRVYGVFKAYYTRVGSGPFPTELTDATGNLVRERGHEYGTTTGRPRRVGWFDAVLGSYAVRINGFDGCVLNHLDVFDTLERIKVCVAYRLDGVETRRIPASVNEYARCEPVFEEFDGWCRDTTAIRRFEDLPQEAQRYVTRVGELLGCPVSMISLGPHRDQTIIREALL